MVHRNDIIGFINDRLESSSIKDASANGMQVEGADKVEKIVFGVSASLELIARAAKAGASMVIVHHGLIWSEPSRITGSLKNKLAVLLKNGITLAAWHLPLDKHPVIGNNAQIIKILGADSVKPFGSYGAETIGFKGRFSKPRTMDSIVETLLCKLGSKTISLDFGPQKIRTLGVISGGASGMFSQAIAAGLDLYITGDIAEPTQELARENGKSYISAGHYNSEKPGIWALEKLVRSKFRVKTEFIDIPNPF